MEGNAAAYNKTIHYRNLRCCQEQGKEEQMGSVNSINTTERGLKVESEGKAVLCKGQ